MENNKMYRITFRLNEKEYAEFNQKYNQTKCKSMSSYLRYMALNGNIIVYPEEEWRAIRRAISSVANNINQITVRYHYSKQLYQDDIQDLKDGIEEINQQLCSLIIRLSQSK